MPLFLLPLISAILTPVISKLVGKAESLPGASGLEKFSWVKSFFDDAEDILEKYGVISKATHDFLDKWDGMVSLLIEKEVAKLKAPKE